LIDLSAQLIYTRIRFAIRGFPIKNRSLQNSPDCSGYAAWSVCTCSQAAAFERKAGPKILMNSNVPLLKHFNHLYARLINGSVLRLLLFAV